MHISNQIASFNYHGAKFSVLKWLLPLLPECKHFIDVFGGSAVVLINRDPSPIETFNDKNKKIVNFFNILRDCPDDLIRLLELTPHSKHEYDNAWFAENDTPIEQARKFFIRTQQSLWAMGAQDKVKGWAASFTDSRVNMSEKTKKWLNGIQNLYEVVERLRRVQIECRDFRFIMSKYDSPDTLFYLDSPYDQTFRNQQDYEFDFVNQDFFDMHYYAKKAKGKVAISGYDSPFMKELFKDFDMHCGPQRKNNRSQKIAKESLWTNY